MIISEQYVRQYIKEHSSFEPVIQSIHNIDAYVCGSYYDAKNDRLDALLDNGCDYAKLVNAIFTFTLLNPQGTTIQAMCGKLNNRIKLPSLINRVKTIAEMIAICEKSELLIIKRNGESIMVFSRYRLPEEIPTEPRHEISMHKPQKLTGNNDEVQGSILLGSYLNHHEDELCLEHLNVMNSIPLSLNIDFMLTTCDEPSFDIETRDQQEEWNRHQKETNQRCLELSKHNRFFNEHKYCTRGRTYSTGYYVTTQGTSYKKAMVDLYNKEVVTDEL